MHDELMSTKIVVKNLKMAIPLVFACPVGRWRISEGKQHSLGQNAWIPDEEGAVAEHFVPVDFLKKKMLTS